MDSPGHIPYRKIKTCMNVNTAIPINGTSFSNKSPLGVEMIGSIGLLQVKLGD